ncbi:MAG: hypothetical protein KDK23_07560 [Leptospiraceae bacterium]|nr:hypothetical protein [Leptospiraceae bacterium]
MAALYRRESKNVPAAKGGYFRKARKKPAEFAGAWVARAGLVAALLIGIAFSSMAAEEPGAGPSLDEALDELDGPSGSGAQDTTAIRLGNTNLRLIDISLVGDFALGFSNLDDSQIQSLQAGLHDPRRKGFSMTSLEMSFSGAVDPYFYAEAHVNLSHGAEVEEAFITSQSLPFGLQLELGKFYTEFGLLNPQHPHTWAFMDAPSILTRVMGDHGLNSEGLRLGWLLPVPWFSELHFGVQNADGEMMKSFLGASEAGGHSHGTEEEVPIGGYDTESKEANSPKDMAYLLRWENSFDVTDTATAKFGISGMVGPNATGPEGRTVIYGADLYVKWRPATNYRGFPYLIWQSEVMRRDYRVHKMPDTGRLANTYAILGGKFFEPYDETETFTTVALSNLANDSFLSSDQGNFGLAIAVLTGSRDFSTLSEEEAKQAIEAMARITNPKETLHDWGYYTQLVLGFVRGWSAGLRYEFASGSGESRVSGGEWLSGKDLFGRDRDPARDTRVRVSPLIIYQPSEFTRFRLQYNQEWADHLRDRKVLTLGLNEINASLPAYPVEFVLQDKGRAAWSVWIGAEFLIGHHPAHKF